MARLPLRQGYITATCIRKDAIWLLAAKAVVDADMLG